MSSTPNTASTLSILRKLLKKLVAFIFESQPNFHLRSVTIKPDMSTSLDSEMPTD